MHIPFDLTYLQQDKAYRSFVLTEAVSKECLSKTWLLGREALKSSIAAILGKNASPPAGVEPPLLSVPEQSEIRADTGTHSLDIKHPKTAFLHSGT